MPRTSSPAVAVLVALLLCAGPAAADVPRVLGYQGRLLDGSGTQPEAGTVNVTFAIFASANGQDELWREEQRLALTQGFYATFLGESVPLPASVFGGGDRWLELSVEGEPLTPRQRIGAVLYSMRAHEAVNVAGGLVEASIVKVGGATVIDSAGRLAGAARYRAGNGITVDDGTQTIGLPGCAAGQILKWQGSGWACAEDGGATYSPARGGGLSMSTNNEFSLSQSCRAGELLKFNGSEWACSVDSGGTVTSISTSAPLTVTNPSTTPAISLPAASAASDGYLSRTDWSFFYGKLDGTAAAGGDLAGNFPSPHVARIQGNPVANLAPGAGQVFKWNGSQWAPGPDDNSGGTVTSVSGTGPVSVANATTAPVISVAAANATTDGYLTKGDWAAFNAKLGSGSLAAGDLGGTFPGPAVVRLQGHPVANTAPANNQVLKWNGLQWAPATDATNPGTVTSVSGSGPISVATGTSTPVVSISQASATSNGYLSSGDWSTFSGKLGAASTAGGDVTGTFSSLVVGRLQGRTVANTAPASGNVLKFNGTAWAPAVDAVNPGTVTNVSGSGPISVANGTTTPTISIAQASATAGGYLSSADWSSFNNKLGAASTAGGDVTGAFSSLVVGRLQGNPVANTAPAASQVLKWNGSQWAPATDATNPGTVTSVTGSGPISVASGTTTPAISISQASATTSGYLSSSDWATFNGRMAANATAGGDLTGSLPNPVVARLQGNPVANTAPAANQVLKWNGSQWAPATDATNPGTVTSVTGSGPISVASGTTTPAISIARASATANGYLNSTDWSAFNAKMAANQAAGGDLSGSLPTPTVARLQGRAVATTAPTAGQMLRWNGTTSAWEPATPVSSVTGSGPITVANGTTTPAISIAQASATASGYLNSTDWSAFNGKMAANQAAGGDLSGSLPNPTVARLQGRAVASTAPTSGQALVYNGSTWAPATAGGDASGALTALTVGRLQNRAVASTAPAGGQVLKWNGTSSQWEPAADNNAGGTVTSVSASGPISVANGTTTPAISIAQSSGTANGYLSSTDWTTFNNKLGTASTAGGDAAGTFSNLVVDGIQGRPVAATAPASGNMLRWNGTQWAVVAPDFLPLTGGSLSGSLDVGGALVMGGNTAIDAGSGWHRTYGNTGWFNGTHGGGWYMEDSTWIRSYNSKSVYIDQTLLVGGNVNVVGTVTATSFGGAPLECYTTGWGAWTGCVNYPDPQPPACASGYTYTGIGNFTQSDSGCGVSALTNARVTARCCRVR